MTHQKEARRKSKPRDSEQGTNELRKTSHDATSITNEDSLRPCCYKTGVNS